MTTARPPILAPAKVNLTLHVTGRRPDGHHDLDSLVTFARFGDTLTLRDALRLALTVTGPLAEGVPTDGRNLILRAAHEVDIRNIHITLDKHLPHAAGLGGGTSDAAALLRALGRRPADPMRLGADLPVCLLGQPARMRGAGADVMPVAGVPELPCVLVNPRIELPTGQVFAGLRRPDNSPMPDALPAWSDPRDMARWLSLMRNDLEPAACALAPRINTVRQALEACGALIARMSGSGATVFGLFDSQGAAKNAAMRLRAAHESWWIKASTLTSSAPARL